MGVTIAININVTVNIRVFQKGHFVKKKKAELPT